MEISPKTTNDECLIGHGTAEAATGPWLML
jgi:hypothetical protein